MIELHAIFKGKVQGVGFRWTVVDYADRYKLKGCVKNLRDGTVEVFAQGAKEDLAAFLDLVQKEPGLARIDSVASKFQEPNEEYTHFRIVH